MSANTPQTGPQRQPPQREAGKPTMAERLATPKAFLGLLITVAAVWFIIANNQLVRIHLWVPWVTARMWVVLLLTFVAGALVGYLFATQRRRRRRRREND